MNLIMQIFSTTADLTDHELQTFKIHPFFKYFFMVILKQSKRRIFMLQVKINHSETVEINQEGGKLLFNETPSDYELIKKTGKEFTLIRGSQIYDVEVLSFEGKQINISINNEPFSLEISDHIDQILEKLGMDSTQSNKVKEIKAPMPGSILNVMVKEKDTVQSGDPILVLEAMKMENVIKSPGDGIVGTIHIAEKENVEKNQVLITFD